MCKRESMTRTLTMLTLAAVAALAGCNNTDNTIDGNQPADPMAENMAQAAPVELPPAIAASKIYRCKDNGVVYIDWLADNQTANLRSGKTGTATQLKAPAPGETLVAEGGYSLKGSAEAGSVTLTRPGIGTESCKA